MATREVFFKHIFIAAICAIAIVSYFLYPEGPKVELKVGYPAHWGTTIPALQHTAYGDSVLGNVFETLLVEEKGGRLVSNLATSWEVTDYFRVIRFKIDTTKRFSNGVSLKAQHFKDAWENGLKMTPRSANSSLRDVLHLVEGYKDFEHTGVLPGVKVLSDSELEIHFTESFRTSVYEFATTRMAVFLQDGLKFYGTGPFEFKSETETELKLTANPYTKTDMDFQDIKITFVPPDLAKQALEEGRIDIYAFADRGAFDACALRRVGVECYAGNETGHLLLFLNGMPERVLSDQKLRQGLQALLYQELTQNVLPSHYRNNFRLDFQPYLPLQQGRLEDNQIEEIFSEQSLFVKRLINKTKETPLFVVASKKEEWVLDLLQKIGIKLSSESGVVATKDRVNMYYKGHEPDIIVSGASIASSDPDGLFHVAAEDGAIFSPMIYRKGVSELLFEGRKITMFEDLHSHYQRVPQAVLQEIPFVHLGFIRGVYAYNKDKVQPESSVRGRDIVNFTVFKRVR